MGESTRHGAGEAPASHLQSARSFTIQAVIDALECAVVVLDDNADIVCTNHAWRLLSDDIAGEASVVDRQVSNYLDLLTACLTTATDLDRSTTENTLAGIKAVLRGASPSFSTELRCHAGERTRWFALTANCLPGCPRHLIVTYRDVTENKRVALELQRDREQQGVLRLLLEISHAEGTVRQLLDRFLDTLLTTPWLATRPKGGIHLLAQDGRGPALTIARNLEPGLVSCRRLLPAECCTASPDQFGDRVIFCGRQDNFHIVACSVANKLPHWCLPLHICGRRVGVLVVYLPPEASSDPGQDVFLKAAADILCAMIRQKLSDESQTKLLLALQQTSNAVLIANEKSEIEFVNEAFTAITGYLAEEISGKTPRFLRSDKTSPESIAALWEALNCGRSWRGELVNRRKNGELFVARQIISPVIGPDGIASHYLSIFEDATAQRALADELDNHRQHLESLVAERTQALSEANRALQEQAAFIQAITDHVPALISYWGTDLRCRFANPGYQECYGKSPEAMIGTHLQELLGDRQFADIEEHIADVFMGKEKTFGRTRVCVTGRLRHAQVSYIPDIQDGRILGFYAFGADVTTLKETKRQLATRTADLERTQSISHVGSWQLDVATNSLTWSDESYRIFGVAPGTPLSLAAFAGFIHPEDSEWVLSAWNAALAGAPYDIEHRIVVCGKTKWVRERAELVFDDNGHPLVAYGAVQDISDRKAAEAAAQAALEEARRMAAIKSEFLANMSHEIRTPLNAVLGFAQTGIRDNAGRKAQVSFRRILDSGQHLLGIINDILDYSKIEAGKLKIECVPFGLLAIIQRATGLTSSRAHHKGLDFQTILSPDLPRTVEGDPLRLSQILVNLLSNAIKFTDSGQVLLSVAQDGEQIVFHVTDTGIGMSAQEIERLFVAFEQADKTTTRRFGGTGLGLAISARLSRAMGGTIRVESQPGKGATFQLRLPLPATTSVPASGLIDWNQQLTMSETELAGRLVGIRILIAEDTAINRTLIEDMLAHEGAVLDFVEDGQQAVAWIRDHGAKAVDLVLMDVQMPVMDGHEATRQILALAPGMPVIGLTAHALHEERDKCMASGMVQHIGKPVDIEILIAAILRHTSPGAAVSTVVQAETRRSEAMGIEFDDEDSPIDRAALMATFNARHDFINRLLDLTLKNYADTPARLREAVQAGDFSVIASIAHTLKSVAGSIKAGRVYELACQTENAIQSNADDAAMLTEVLAKHLAILIAYLSTREKAPSS
jgi:PAS domain S-box-containing protein